MKKLCFSILAALFVLLAWNWSSVDAFQPVSTTVNTQSPFGQSNRSVVRSLASNRRQQDPLNEAMEKLKTAEDSNEKEEAMDAIRVELEKQYDQFLDENEQQIEQLQERLDKLRDQLVRRKSAKNKMVDLEIERVVNESEGLVWPGRTNQRSRFPSGMFFDRPATVPVPAAMPPGQSSGMRARRPAKAPTGRGAR